MELQVIQNKIYEIRGYRVMLDFDLAEMYGIETRVLKQSVRRNMKRFEGDDFMFELTRDELSRSQFVILDRRRGGNIKYLPFAFTELGVAMLSSVLNSDTAIEINRAIMRAFVAIRKTLYSSSSQSIEDRIKALEAANEELLKDLNDLSEDTRNNFDDIYMALSEMAATQKAIDKPRNPIGFKREQSKN